MIRSASVHYINPYLFGITPNANASTNDLFVYTTNKTTIKVYCPKLGLDFVDGAYPEWKLTGRNRRLAQSEGVYTIYARLSKTNRDDAYIVFAPMVVAQVAEHKYEWYDKYSYLTRTGLSVCGAQQTVVDDPNYWYVRLGEVSEPIDGQRVVELDTGILGTAEWNNDWALNPDALPLRIETRFYADGKDAGVTPYVHWGESVELIVQLAEGWTGTDIQRFDHWTIAKSEDEDWPNADRKARFAKSGTIVLSHSRGDKDDFDGAVSAVFTVTAWEKNPDYGTVPGAEEYLPLISTTVTVMAETAEKLEVVPSEAFVTYDTQTGRYTPADGIKIHVRATDQRGEAFELSKRQIDNMVLKAYYGPASAVKTPLTFADEENVATATIPVSAFAAQKNIDVRLVRVISEREIEMNTTTIAFVRDGKSAQYIYLRGTARDVDGNIKEEVPCQVSVTGGKNLSTNSRGLNMVTLNKQTLELVESISYDTYGEAVEDPDRNDDGITNLIAKLNEIKMPGQSSRYYEQDVFVCLVSRDAIGWNSELISLLQEFGLGNLPYTATGRYPFLFIGANHLGFGNGRMRMRNVGAWTDVVELSTYVEGGALVVMDGESAVRLDLDNEHEDFLYNDTGLVSPAGGAIVTPRLFDGGVQVTEGITWAVSMDDRNTWSGPDAHSIGGRDADVVLGEDGWLNVLTLNVLSAKVIIRALYNGNYYYAEFTANKTMQDKYDLSLIPNAISYNPATFPTNGVTITPSATHTDLQGTTEKVNIGTDEDITEGHIYLFYGYVNSRGGIENMVRLTSSTYTAISDSVAEAEGVYFELRKATSYDETSGEWQFKTLDYDTIPFAKVQNGKDAVRLDLDNEMDSILYDGAGNKVSGSVSTTVYMYEGANDVSTHITAISIISSENISSEQISINGHVVTVSGLTADGYVIIGATYKGKVYNAKFSVKKISGKDKFELDFTPSAISVNTSDAQQPDRTVSVQVFRTPANGGERHVVAWTNRTINNYLLALVVKDNTGANLTETTGTGEVTTRTFKFSAAQAQDNNITGINISLGKKETPQLPFVTQDSETILVARVQNGRDGTGANAVRIDLDNEMDAIPCDKDGKVLSETTISTIARIYDGATPVVSGVDAVSVGSIAGIAGTVNGTQTPVQDITDGIANVQWVIPADTLLSVGRYTAGITLQWNNKTYHATFVVAAVKSGKEGESPTVMQLLPSPSQVIFKEGDTASKKVTMSIKKTIGDETSVISIAASGLDVRYSYDRPATSTDVTWPEQEQGLSIAPNTNKTQIYVAAFNGATLVDRETIPIIKDGQQGLPAISGYADFLFSKDASGNQKPSASAAVLGMIDLLQYTDDNSDRIDVCEYYGDRYSWEGYDVPDGSVFACKTDGHLYRATPTGWQDEGMFRGNDATVYKIEFTEQNFFYDPNAQYTFWGAKGVVNKIVGDTIEPVDFTHDNTLAIRIFITWRNADGTTGSLEVDAAHHIHTSGNTFELDWDYDRGDNYISLITVLEINGNEVARNSIPYSKNGDKGQDAYEVHYTPAAVSFNCNSSGKSVDTSVKVIAIDVFKGLTVVTGLKFEITPVNCFAWSQGATIRIATGQGWRNGDTIVYTKKPYPFCAVGEDVYNENGEVIGQITDVGETYIHIDGDSESYTGLSNRGYYNLSEGGEVTIKISQKNSDFQRTVKISVSGNIQGAAGVPGAAGPMLYPAGVWKAQTYEAEGDARPYVFYNGNADNTGYYYLNADVTSASDTPGTSDKWTKMTQMDVVYAKFGIMDYGQMASAIFCGDWMYSQYGKLWIEEDGEVKVLTIDETNYDTEFTFVDGEGVPHTAVPFAWFDPKHPKGGELGRFSPNYAVNFKIGYILSGGAGSLANGNIEWDVTGAIGMTKISARNSNFYGYTNVRNFTRIATSLNRDMTFSYETTSVFVTSSYAPTQATLTLPYPTSHSDAEITIYVLPLTSPDPRIPSKWPKIKCPHKYDNNWCICDLTNGGIDYKESVEPTGVGIIQIFCDGLRWYIMSGHVM